MQNVVISKNDLERDFAATIYLSEAPSPPRFLPWGASSNCVASQSGQIQSVKLYSICSPTQLIFHPLPRYTLHTYIYLYLFIQERRGVLNQREGERGNPGKRTDHIAGSKIPT
jgi:hypothetical protein